MALDFVAGCLGGLIIYKSYSKNKTFSGGSPQEILNNLCQNHNGLKFLNVLFLFV